MNNRTRTARWGKRLVIIASLALCVGMGTTQALAAVDTTSNNFTMIAPDGGITGGTNDVYFTWDGTKLTSVTPSGQVPNATISSETPFFGVPWTAHDVAIYGSGIYTVYTDCDAGSPGCGAGTPITFTVGSGQLGVHMLFDWGGNGNIDVVDLWVPAAAFAPSPLYAGPDGGTNPADKVWDWMSSDWDGDGYNGYGMVDGPFAAFNANFNMMGVIICACDDGDPCTTDSCDLGTGSCVYTNAPDNTSCNDGDYNECTLGVCLSGICQPGLSLDCNDNNLCTTDNCDPEMGCYYTAKTCNDANGCTTDSCDPATGNCVYANNANPCILDGVSCMQGACSGGNCALGATRRMCDDNNSCTDDSCDDATFHCVNTNKADLTSCDDSNACTLNDLCTAGSCAGTPTEDCMVHGRLMVEAGSYFCMGAAYPSGNCVALTAGVDGGVVLGEYQRGQFDVVDPAKPDVCGNNAGSGIGTGYGLTDIGGPQAIAQPFGFFGSPTYISTNPVSWQACNAHPVSSAQTGAIIPANGCLKITADMSAWEVYWNGSVFEQGPRKTAGVPLNATGRLCPDNTYRLTWPALIVGGPFSGVTGYWLLVGHHIQCDVSTCDDGNVCTDDSFDAENCLCVHGNNTASCSDGNACTTGDACSAGICGMLTNCDDGNLCTTDSCDPASGNCSHTFNTDGCDDLDACTVNDTCSGGVCAGTAANCDDADDCTADSCDPATGCVHTSNAASCDDNNTCTTGDICSNGVCAGTPIICDDGNVCTTDSCNPATGCVNTAINCTDNNACTIDSCNPTTGCAYSPLPVFSDNNPCTDDSCDPATGAPVYTSNTSLCNDGLFCTSNDTCSNGVCVGGADPCTGNTACNEATDHCDTVCQKTALIRGGGQSPNNVDLQIQTLFTVTNDGCVLGSTTGTVTVSVGSVVSVDCHQGKGPNATSGTWNGVAIPKDTPLSIVCPTVGEAGKLVITNKDAAGGKDTDRVTILVQ
ncbi:MAG: hypothetical protein M0R70_14510 [Nitrospirae bacterium]|nr:hypothetical protein [Nitrospirota bacterium]